MTKPRTKLRTTQSNTRLAMWGGVGAFYGSALALVLVLFSHGSLNYVLGWLVATVFTGIGAKLLMDFVAGDTTNVEPAQSSMFYDPRDAEEPVGRLDGHDR